MLSESEIFVRSRRMTPEAALLTRTRPWRGLGKDSDSTSTRNEKNDTLRSRYLFTKLPTIYYHAAVPGI